MTIRSYAQNFEDVRLWRALGHVDCGRYLDVGAQDPVRDSVSLAFYEHGWRGTHVEPSPAYAQALRGARPDELVIQAAVGPQLGTIPFFEICGTGLSTGVQDIAESHVERGFELSEIEVPCIPLSEIFDRMGQGPIHWLKIDVEGMEADVLNSWGDHPQRPWILVIEATAPNSQTPSHQAWRKLAISRGYREVLFDGLNRYFLLEGREELKPALILAPNIFDGFQVTPAHFSAIQIQAENAEIKSTFDAELDLERNRTVAATMDTERLRGQLEERSEQHMRQIDLLQAAREEIDQVRAEQLARAEQELQRLRDLEGQARADVAALQIQLKTEGCEAELAKLRLTDQLRVASQLLQERRTSARPGWGHRFRQVFSTTQRAVDSGFIAALVQWEHDRAGDHIGPEQSNNKGEAMNGSIGSPVAITHPAASLEDLCTLYDREFVECAYLTLLKRRPDPDGAQYYLSRLRQGAAKYEILLQLRRSVEGRQYDPAIFGLDRALQRYRKANLPLIGRLWNWRKRIECDTAIERQLRILQNELGRRNFAQLETKLDVALKWMAEQLPEGELVNRSTSAPAVQI